MSRRREPRVRLDLAFAGAGGTAAESSGRLFAVACPGCSGELAVTTDMAGGEARCPACAAPFTVPEPRIAEPAVPRAVTISHFPAEPAAAMPAPPSPAEPAAAGETRAEAVEPVSMTALPATAIPDEIASSPASPPPPSPERDDAVTAPPQAGPDAPRGELEFREPIRSITVGDATIELRRLSPEEKQARRARRNLLILVVGAAILFALVLLLGRT